MPKKRRDEDSVFLRGLLPYKDFISAMETKHRVPAVELGRGLFAAAAAFYEEHGWFSFPVVIEPQAFQAQFVAANQDVYGKGVISPAGDQLEKDLTEGLQKAVKPRPRVAPKSAPRT